jgi:hypothetical protein
MSAIVLATQLRPGFASKKPPAQKEEGAKRRKTRTTEAAFARRGGALCDQRAIAQKGDDKSKSQKMTRRALRRAI